MRNFTLMLVAAMLAMSATFASAAEGTDPPRPAQQNGPLKPGRSAGVRVAQLPRTGLALVGASAIIAVIAVAAGTGGSNGNSNNPQSNLQSVSTTTP